MLALMSFVEDASRGEGSVLEFTVTVADIANGETVWVAYFDIAHFRALFLWCRSGPGGPSYIRPGYCAVPSGLAAEVWVLDPDMFQDDASFALHASPVEGDDVRPSAIAPIGVWYCVAIPLLRRLPGNSENGRYLSPAHVRTARYGNRMPHIVLCLTSLSLVFD